MYVEIAVNKVGNIDLSVANRLHSKDGLGQSTRMESAKRLKARVPNVLLPHIISDFSK